MRFDNQFEWMFLLDPSPGQESNIRPSIILIKVKKKNKRIKVRDLSRRKLIRVKKKAE
jgi:hypothetical protein